MLTTVPLELVLENRYYGESFPTLPDLSTKSLRFLDTAQTIADMAYFAQNIVFPGFEDKNLTSANVPYIMYGSSLSGSQAAFVRKTYPDVYWGAIASSATLEAIEDGWNYLSPIAKYGEPECISIMQKITNSNDNIIAFNSKALTDALKTVWGLPNVTYTGMHHSLFLVLCYSQDFRYDTY